MAAVIYRERGRRHGQRLNDKAHNVDSLSVATERFAKISTNGHEHMKRPFALLLFLCLLHPTSAMGSLPAVTHYKLNTVFDLKERRVSMVATLSIKNGTDKPHATLPFLLYRLLTVELVGDNAGTQLTFRQTVGQLRDEPAVCGRIILHNRIAPVVCRARST